MAPHSFSCLDNSMDREACQATVHGVAQRVDMTEHAHTVVGVCFGLPKCFLKFIELLNMITESFTQIIKFEFQLTHEGDQIKN